MGSFSGYSSPKPSYDFSPSMSSAPVYSASSFDEVVVDTLKSTKKDLNSFKNLITSYLEIQEKIEKLTEILSTLQKEKATLEEKISSNPEFGKFSSMFNSMNNFRGPKR